MIPPPGAAILASWFWPTGPTIRTTPARHVLHAAPQAKNVLQGATDWHTIDPLGAIGDINAEAALWVAIQDGPATVADRLGELTDHPLLDRHRLPAWTYVLSVAEYRSYLPASALRIEQLWEALEMRGEPDDSERRDAFREKAHQLIDGGTAAHLPADTRVRAAQDLLFTLMGLITWNFAVPGMCRMVLDEETDQAAWARRRETVIETARTLATNAGK
ncbi:hypothetical protein [Nocardia sp. NPDC051750]|uniref:hypothetical protein n=1 Tax=Nocardia sp. NPDC051750 TaxID=3364325 RepID=UPI00379B4BB2